MKLMTAKVSFDYVIVVKDDATKLDPLNIAYEYVRDAARDLSSFDFDIDVYDYQKVKADGWDDLCIPYGGDGNTTTGDYLKETK